MNRVLRVTRVDPARHKQWVCEEWHIEMTTRFSHLRTESFDIDFSEPCKPETPHIAACGWRWVIPVGNEFLTKVEDVIQPPENDPPPPFFQDADERIRRTRR